MFRTAERKFSIIVSIFFVFHQNINNWKIFTISHTSNQYTLKEIGVFRLLLKKRFCQRDDIAKGQARETKIRKGEDEVKNSKIPQEKKGFAISIYLKHPSNDTLLWRSNWKIIFSPATNPFRFTNRQCCEYFAKQVNSSVSVWAPLSFPCCIHLTISISFVNVVKL